MGQSADRHDEHALDLAELTEVIILIGSVCLGAGEVV